MSNIASQNTILQFGPKLRASLEGLRAELKAQKETQNAKYTLLIWAFGFATVILFGSNQPISGRFRVTFLKNFGIPKNDAQRSNLSQTVR